MKPLRCARVFGLAFGAACLAVACGHPPVKTQDHVQAPPPPPAPETYSAHVVLTASADVNPDATGRPSPIVVRIYQLKDDALFKGADFFAVYDTAEKTLGVSAIGPAREFEIAPGERKAADIEISAKATFVSVLAAFRDIRNAQWRSVIPAGPLELTVSVERARVVLARAGS